MNTNEFSKAQLQQIALGRKESKAFEKYIKPEYNAFHMEQIRLGLADGVSVEQYADPRYDWLQMQEIRKGLQEGVDVSLYASFDIPHDKMHLMRKGLLQGINLKKYLYLDSPILKQLLVAKECHVDIMEYIRHGYDAEQLAAIIRGLSGHVDIMRYFSPVFRGAALQEICEGLEEGLDVSVYAKEQFGPEQMREIRRGLESRVDVGHYNNPLFSAEQMREIRIGLEEDIDVTEYARFMYTAQDMRRIRLEIAGRDITQTEDDILREVQDQGFVVTVNEDQMEAYMMCDGSGEYGTEEEILAFLRKSKIVKGILSSAVKKIAEGDVEEDTPILVARGIEPKLGKDGWYEFFFRQEIAKAPRVLDDGTVDYRTVEWYETVKEGQKIAEYHNAVEGEQGWTVTGNSLRGKKGIEQKMLRGSGYYLSEDGKTYYAAMDGRIELRKDMLVISRVFFFDEITLATGNVDVDGNVHVAGMVGANASVKATGDIVIDGFIEGANIQSGGSIFLRNGVNASGKGTIYAAENVAGKFFESANIRADGDIYADYCMGSNLYAKGQIRMFGTRGSIIGGITFAERGIAADQLGNEVNAPTWIRFGTHPTTLVRYAEIEKEIKNSEHELDIFKNAYEDFNQKYAEHQLQGIKMYNQVEKAIYTKEVELQELTEEKKKLESMMEESEQASVAVKMLYENVQIESASLKWKSKKVANVRLRRADDHIALYNM